MRNNSAVTKIRKSMILFSAGLSAFAILVSTVSVFQHYDRCRFFERKTGVSLAAFENVKVWGNDSITGSGRVEVTGQLPHKEIEGFIKNRGFMRFDMQYTGTYSSNWNDREYELWVLQERIFGIPPLRYRHFPKASKMALPPDSDVYFLLNQGKDGQAWYMILEKRAGTFLGCLSY
jgi:hypothetical protein